MSNNNSNSKIRTMKDDLVEAEKQHKEHEESVQAKKQESPATETAPASKLEHNDTKEVTLQQTKEKEAGSEIEKKQNSEADELKDLISKISKTTQEEQIEQPKEVVPHDHDKEEKKETPAPVLEKADEKEKTAAKTVKEEQAEKNAALEKPASGQIDKLKDLIKRISGTVEEKRTEETDKTKNIIEKKKDDKKASSAKEAAPQITATEEITKDKSKKPLWKNILKKLKIGGGHQKTAELGKTKEKEEEYKTGILEISKKKEAKEETEKEKKPKKSLFPGRSDYMSPEERLIYGKQEYYSSIAKKIKPKEREEEVESLKDVVIKKEKKVLSKEEEYKKLKQSIIKKYHIKLFSLPWKKIVLIAVIVLASVGLITYYYLASRVPPPPPPPPPPVVGVELKEFSTVGNRIELTRNDIKQVGLLEERSWQVFSSNKNVEVLKLIITDGKNIIPLKEALSDIKIKTDRLPESFLSTTTNSYNLFVFKTKQDTLRLGIALKSNNIESLAKVMKEWEEEDIENKKMFYVFKPLFMSDEIREEIGKSFKTASYKGIRIRYIHLPDQNTAFNYFTYGDILVITTSKDTTFKMVDLIRKDL